MADNTRLNLGTTGDTIRDVDKGGGVKTQSVVLDVGGTGVESLVTAGNPMPVTGPLTDTQLRASPVPVSGTVATGGLTNAQLRAAGVLVSFPQENLSPFGDLNIASLTALIQLDFVYGINTQTGVSAVVTTGVVNTDSSRLQIQSGVGAAGSGLFTSRRPAHYRPGQGTIARFTAAFTAGELNSTQIVGMGSATNGYFFGFNGNTFGLLFRNSGTPTWIAQTAWNGDKCDGTGASGFNWNPLFGNVCQIKYPYLGYGNITFWVQDSTTSRFILCHTIRYTNTTVLPELSIPNLYFYAQAVNAGNTSNLIVYVGSVGIFLSGERSFSSAPKWAADNSKAAITAETSILGIRNCTTFNGVANSGLLRINSISYSTSTAAKTAAAGILRMRIGATLGGVPAYTPVNGSTADNGVTLTSANSLASFDVAATTCTGGTYIYAVGVNDAGCVLVDLSLYQIFVAPGETLSIAGFGSSALYMGVTVSWTEDQ